MKQSTSTILGFLIGASIGGAIGVLYSKKKYEKIAQEEIDSVKEAFTVPKEPIKYKEHSGTYFVSQTDAPQPYQVVVPKKQEPDLSIYKAFVQNQGYSDYSREVTSRPPVPKTLSERDISRPYVISPHEWSNLEDGMDEEYDTITFRYYDDGVVCNESNEPLTDMEVEDLIGKASLSTFGDYEDDCVYVRNHKLKTDFEILKTDKNFYEIKMKKPHEE